jgi:hypothetical protein
MEEVERGIIMIKRKSERKGKTRIKQNLSLNSIGRYWLHAFSHSIPGFIRMRDLKLGPHSTRDCPSFQREEFKILLPYSGSLQSENRSIEELDAKVEVS